MHVRPLPAEEGPVRRYVEELWLPYHRELEATVECHALAEDVDLVAEEVAFRRERIATTPQEVWVAIDIQAGAGSGDAGFEGEFAGFVTTDIDAAPAVFDRPDRLVVDDIYVRERYRGTGLARELVASAAERARAAGCAELALDVDADNPRAAAFYEKLGFEPLRSRLTLSADAL
jgi:ribosomal protein S18 acetylase RimI-like enzyme